MGLVCRFLMCTAVCVSVDLCALSGGGGFEHRGVHIRGRPIIGLADYRRRY